MTAISLAEAALFYLSRYASSSGNLRRVLMRKIARSTAFYGDDPAPLKPIVEALVVKHAQSGAVNDTAYADSQVRKLRRRGSSARLIAQSLGAKGVPAEVVAEAASTMREEGGDPEAALRFAQRRRLGPFRQTGRVENRQRDMAALGRMGFDYQTAKIIVDAENIETLTERIGLT
jgi:regulatory protein